MKWSSDIWIVCTTNWCLVFLVKLAIIQKPYNSNNIYSHMDKQTKIHRHTNGQIDREAIWQNLVWNVLKLVKCDFAGFRKGVIYSKTA